MQTNWSKSRNYEVPKLESESGLAEWTSKIKALQRQVDEDEEAEQKRLEEEIAASRMARLRRSQGMGHSSQVKSLDLSQGKQRGAIKTQGPLDGVPNDIVDTNLGRQNTQAHALQQRTISDSPLPTSLAAFIGGRASGPKLNKHALQQDVNGSAQSEQYKTNRNTHPIFGKGGVAMPGMAQHGKPLNTASQHTSESTTQNSPISSPVSNAPNISPIIGQGVGKDDRVAELHNRAQASPSSTSKSWNIDKRIPVEFPRHPRKHSSPSATIVGSGQGLDLSSRATSMASSLPSKVNRPMPPRYSSDTSIIPVKSSITVPSLARPILPEARLSPNLPQTPPSQAPSPAFLRSPPQKDPTPSISRLQGRGFVQNMVKVSVQRESPPMSSDRTSEQGSTSGGRRTSVLDRWQPHALPTPLSPSTPTPRPIHRSVATEDKPETPRPLAPTAGPPKMLKPAVSSPSLRQLSTVPPPRHTSRDGLGSATTLIVYKPNMADTVPQVVSGVDELGFQGPPVISSAMRDERRRKDLPTQTGNPLSHLTKDRARKPRKSKSANSKPRSDTSMTHVQQPTQPSSHTHILEEVIADKREVLRPLGTLEMLQSHKSIGGGALLDHIAHVTSATAEPSFQKFTNPVVGGDEVHPRTISVSAEIATPLKPHPPSNDHQNNIRREKHEASSEIPHKHSRIPSTRQRPTVMDIAETLNGQVSKQGPSEAQELGMSDFWKLSGECNRTPESSTIVANAEKRKSNYEKYVPSALPPLQEELTPVHTPSGSLSQLPVGPQWQTSDILPADEEQIMFTSTTAPTFNLDDLLNSHTPAETSSPESKTISVDVMIVTGKTTIPVTHESAIFYDTEVLAVVHRFKFVETSLVSTTLWCWRGKRCNLGEKEERKLEELAKHYGTTVRIILQNSEPPALVRILGGRLVTRQGTRTHWTRENTAMHLVRFKDGVVFIDEHDLNVRNLCPAFSYCVSILDTIYVWYGRGSIDKERQAAFEYAREVEKSGLRLPVVELVDGEDDNDEMFWIILGAEDFAAADYWRWRKSSSVIDPRAWKIKSALGNDMVLPVDSFTGEHDIHESVYLIYCVWELYVLVGRDAQNQKDSIRLAILVAAGISARVAPERPFTPTVHVLTLPTQLPRDLRMNIRDLDETLMNGGNTPDCMNVLSYVDALGHEDSWGMTPLI